MKSVVLLGLALPLFAPMGAPAWFEVRGAEVEVHRAAGAAEVRIVYDVAVRDAACGWFLGQFDALPAGAAEPKATLLIDGKEYPAAVEDGRGARAVQAFREEREQGVRVLSAAKSIRLVLAFPKAACPGPEITVPIPVPAPEFRGDPEKEPPKDLPRVSVRFDSEVEEATAEVRATFRTVPRGSRLVLRSDARSAGATLVK